MNFRPKTRVGLKNGYVAIRSGEEILSHGTIIFLKKNKKYISLSATLKVTAKMKHWLGARLLMLALLSVVGSSTEQKSSARVSFYAKPATASSGVQRKVCMNPGSNMKNLFCSQNPWLTCDRTGS